MLEHARRFLSLTLPPPEPGAYLNIHWSRIGSDGQKYWDGRPNESVDDAVRTIGWVQRMGPNHDIYVCMSTQARYEDKTSKSTGRTYRKAVRFQQDVKLIRSLYIDVDVKTDLKKEGYDTQKEALDALLEFIRTVAIPIPSTLVASGSGGFHAHWALEHAITLDQWQPLANSLCAAAQQHGLKFDSQCTIDSARILRVPGTTNWKGGTAKPVTLMSEGDKVTYEVMAEALKGYTIVRKPDAPRPDSPFEDGTKAAGAAPGINDDLSAGVTKNKVEVPIAEVAKHCGFISRSIGTGGAGNPNPLWFMSASVANFVEEGREALHLMSNKHPGYEPAATDRLFDRVSETQKKRDLGWPACAKIAGYGAPECQTCPLLQMGKSPLSFVIKAGIQATPDLNLPERYTRDADGIIMIRMIDDKGMPLVLPISHYPVYSGWLSNDPWTLHFITRTETGRKASVDIPTEVVAAGKDTFSKYLGSRGLICTETQYKALKEFFVSWMQKLQAAKESVISASPFGWSVPDGKVEGFAYGGRVWMRDGDRPAANPNPVLAYQYTPKGELPVWREAARVVYEQERPGLDAVLAVAFAAPLVRFTGHGGLILNAYSPESGIGKTTAMKVSQAVWGHPVLAMQGLNDTSNSVLGKMGMIRSLPMFWDEIKSEQQIRMFCSSVFTMTGGREKSRMTQDAQLRLSGQWQTMMVSASNESLVDGMAREAGSTTAGLHRMFEYQVPPGMSKAADVGVVQRLIGKLEDNYGHAGMAYSKFLGVNVVRVEREVAALNDTLLQEVTARQEERMWVATMAVVIKGAEYANELGLTKINVDNLKAFLLGVFFHNRNEVSGSASDMTNDISIINILGEMLNSARVSYTMMTNRIWVSQGKPAAGAIVVKNDISKMRELRVQIGQEDKLIRIASTFVTNWMGERGHSRVTWVKRMEEEFGMRRCVGILGGGTGVVGAKEQLLELDMNHPKLAPFLE